MKLKLSDIRYFMPAIFSFFLFLVFTEWPEIAAFLLGSILLVFTLGYSWVTCRMIQSKRYWESQMHNHAQDHQTSYQEPQDPSDPSFRSVTIRMFKDGPFYRS